MRTQAKVLQKYMHTAQTGSVEWIGLRPDRKVPMQEVSATNALVGRGLEGDRQAIKDNGSARQVTIISREDITVLETLLGKESIHPSILRRNIVVSGINLHPFRYSQLQIGEAIIELGAHCHPCLRMEQAMGTGALLAMYGRGGYCAKVLKEGQISLGDKVSVIVEDIVQGSLFD